MQFKWECKWLNQLQTCRQSSSPCLPCSGGMHNVPKESQHWDGHTKDQWSMLRLPVKSSTMMGSGEEWEMLQLGVHHMTRASICRKHSIRISMVQIWGVYLTNAALLRTYDSQGWRLVASPFVLFFLAHRFCIDGQQCLECAWKQGEKCLQSSGSGSQIDPPTHLHNWWTKCIATLASPSWHNVCNIQQVAFYESLRIFDSHQFLGGKYKCHIPDLFGQDASHSVWDSAEQPNSTCSTPAVNSFSGGGSQICCTALRTPSWATKPQKYYCQHCLGWWLNWWLCHKSDESLWGA